MNTEPNTFAAIFKCHTVLTVTHDEDENFRDYECKNFRTIRWDDRERVIKMAPGYEYFEKYRLPDFDEDDEVEEWKRYRKAESRAIECFDAFTASLKPEEWEAAAADALSRPDEEVPMSGFNAPAIPGFNISASIYITSADAYEIIHAGEDEEEDE